MDHLLPFALVSGFAILLLWVATHRLRTGNLSAKPSLDVASRDRSARPVRYWLTVIPILNAGIGLALVAALIALMGIHEIIGGSR